ncbi:MAG: three-Cys-motif partner protein TcmP [Methylococcales bacterium]|nr:three-Cys-motif partner protein TcmP [Methylococcales bacterium]MDD5754513.1 three-Cys-motif partner protein TcmP [Methylococcales bacterium]
MKKHYGWNPISPPDVDQHSIVKHEIIRSYLIKYVQTLTSSHLQDELKLTLIDGFSGGGIYQHKVTKETVYGSPIVMLEAIKEADFLINQKRLKKLALNVDYFFIDKDKMACDSLKNVLKDKGYYDLIDKSIFIHQSVFDKQIDNITTFISRKSPRSPRAIFLLDQYGYKDVPTSLIRKIFASLKNAEVILTFNVDALLTYATDKKGGMQKMLNQIGTPHALRGRSIEEIKNSEKNSMLFIQSCLHQDLIKNCNAPYYTPFFIRSSNGYGDYWLIHLSQHPRAHDVMKQIHWQKNNHFIHYGNAGLDMFSMAGYVPERDSAYTKQIELDGYHFDDIAEKESVKVLSHQIPALIHKHGHDGITFAELFSNTCNNSPASSEIYKKAINELVGSKEVNVTSPDGKNRQSFNTIHDKDRIIISSQRSLFTPSLLR